MKILFVNHQPHYKIGGIETYTYKLMKSFIDNGFEVHEMCARAISKINNVSNVREKLNVKNVFMNTKFDAYRLSAKHFLRKNIKNYDVVINSTKVYDSKILRSKNHILVQHFPYSSYLLSKNSSKSKSTKFKEILDVIFLHYGVFGDPFEKSSNSVFFSEYTNKGNAKKYWYVPLTSKVDDFLSKTHKEIDIFWMGRLSQQKGISHLIEISKLVKNDIKVAGSGPLIEDVKKHFNENYIGLIKSEDVKDILAKCKVYILTSNFEGAATSIAEALSNGVPVVTFNSFDHANFYGKCNGVKLVETFNYEEFARWINDIISLDENEYKKLSYESWEFAKNNLSDNSFIAKWNKIIKEI